MLPSYAGQRDFKYRYLASLGEHASHNPLVTVCIEFTYPARGIDCRLAATLRLLAAGLAARVGPDCGGLTTVLAGIMALGPWPYLYSVVLTLYPRILRLTLSRVKAW